VRQELWGKISDVFDAALERPLSDRYSYLEEACRGDDELLRQVSHLLSQFDQASDFLEQPIFSRPQVLATASVVGGRYRIEALIGRGGMGEVYRAYDELVGEKVALKTLRSELSADPDFLRRFRREVQLARKVTHSSVCRLFDAGVHEAPDADRLHFFAMQLLEGETLAARIRRDGRLLPEDARNIAAHLSEGLDAAHSAGIIHRDFKSANVMLCDGRAVIMDFGLAKTALVDSAKADAYQSVTADSQLAGTFAYMSPEQLSGVAVTPATDIYSLGVVLFEMATGRLPFDDPHPIRSAMQRAKDGAPDVHSMAPELDAQWASTIARCLHRDPSMRFPSAGAAISHLQPRWRPPMAYWTRRQWMKAAAGGAAAAAGVALIPAAFRYYGLETELPEGSELFLGPINNLTTDDRFDGLTELLRNQLAQSARVNVIDASRVLEVLTQMGATDGATVEASDVREAAWRLNAPLSIYGTVARVGSDYVLNVQAETRGSRPDNPREKLLRSFSAGDPAALMRSVRDASLWLRDIVGESAESIASFDQMPADTTTPSWEALAYFARGQRFYMVNDWDAAALQYEAALREDDSFTLAAMRRADILMSQNRQTTGISQWRAAIAMIDKRPVTRSEELYGRGMFAFDSGDMEAAEHFARTWSTEYPHDWRAPYFRALPLCLNGHGAQAVEVLEALRDVLPEYGDLYVQLIGCHLVLGQTAEARALVSLVREFGTPERADLREAYIRYREGDCVGTLEMLRALQQSGNRRSVVDAMLQEAMLLIDAGYLREAAANAERLLAGGSWFESAPQEAALRVAQAWAEMLDGQTAAAVAHARLALAPESGSLIVALAGTVFARCGALDLAEDALGLTAPFPDIKAYTVARHRIAGELARADGDGETALVELRAAAALEPAIAHRQYLIEALPAGNAERLELAIKVAEVPWQILRPPSIHHIGAMRTVVADLIAAGTANRFVTDFINSTRGLAALA
jgi:eukaryotic-like serine/threonine-protein kinase